jgi:hypothetical protein
MMTTVAQQILAECHEDYVGLWSIVRRIRHEGIPEGTNIIDTTLGLLLPLLASREIIAGQFKDNKFREWKLGPKEVIAKIEAEWKELGHDPDIGEIAWFTSEQGLYKTAELT